MWTSEKRDGHCEFGKSPRPNTWKEEEGEEEEKEEIPHILCIPKVHYRIHKCPSLVTILRQLDPIHNATSYFLKIYLNIILPSTPGSSELQKYLKLNHITLKKFNQTETTLGIFLEIKIIKQSFRGLKTK